MDVHDRVSIDVSLPRLAAAPLGFGCRRRGDIPHSVVTKDTSDINVVQGVHRMPQPRSGNLPLNGVKAYRGEDAKGKADTMRTYWVPGADNLGIHSRRTFADFTAVYEIGREFDALIEAHLTADAAA